jgi:hypothetical protein
MTSQGGGKGRGLWMTSGDRTPWHKEGVKDAKPLVVALSTTPFAAGRLGDCSLAILRQGVTIPCTTFAFFSSAKSRFPVFHPLRASFQIFHELRPQ